MSDILLEVDDELKAQQIKALWQKYGQTVIGLAVAILIGTTVGVFWHGHQTARLQDQTTQLFAVLQGGDGKNANLEELYTLEKQTDAPLKGLVQLQTAQKQENANDLKGAEKTYDDLANEKSANAIVRDLAIVHRVRLGLVQKEKTDGLLNMIEPLTKDDRPFRGSALELKGLLLKDANKTKEANAVFQQLTDDTKVHVTIIQRAHNFIVYETK